MRFMLLICAASFAFVHAAWAGVDEGWDAFNRGDFEIAYQTWKVDAEAGDVRAQAALGSLYREGKGVHANAQLAAQWYSRAAEGNHAAAQYNLAVMFRDGIGVEKSLGSAAHWFHRAAIQNLFRAQVNLGILYVRGLGVQQDPARAMMWFTIAAAQGDARARHNQKRLAKDLTSEQIDQARRLIRDFDREHTVREWLRGTI